MSAEERRRSVDRRVHARGGRRPEDRSGYAPLIFVVTGDSDLRFWEALLLERQFAVVPCNGPGAALEAFKAIRPDIIVASLRDIAAIRERLPTGRRGSPVPLVELVGSPNMVEPVLKAMRRALRCASMTETALRVAVTAPKALRARARR
jgi:hypothetical protein